MNKVILKKAICWYACWQETEAKWHTLNTKKSQVRFSKQGIKNT
jgi:hypothetical protein